MTPYHSRTFDNDKKKERRLEKVTALHLEWLVACLARILRFYLTSELEDKTLCDCPPVEDKPGPCNLTGGLVPCWGMERAKAGCCCSKGVVCAPLPSSPAKVIIPWTTWDCPLWKESDGRRCWFAERIGTGLPWASVAIKFAMICWESWVVWWNCNGCSWIGSWVAVAVTLGAACKATPEGFLEIGFWELFTALEELFFAGRERKHRHQGGRRLSWSM